MKSVREMLHNTLKFPEFEVVTTKAFIHFSSQAIALRYTGTPVRRRRRKKGVRLAKIKLRRGRTGVFLYPKLLHEF